MADSARKLSVEDRLDIQELFAKYAWGLDTGDIDAVLACFVEDGYLEHPPQGKMVGEDGIRRLLDELWHGRGNWFKCRQHIGTHFIIRPEGENGARVKAFWSILQHSVDYNQTFVFALGDWDNSCVKRNGEWLFQAVRVAAWVSEEKMKWKGLRLR